MKDKQHKIYNNKKDKIYNKNWKKEIKKKPPKNKFDVNVQSLRAPKLAHVKRGNHKIRTTNWTQSNKNGLKVKADGLDIEAIAFKATTTQSNGSKL